ncbi:hypothetical protein H6F32_08380 [Anabaena sp. FACHB-1237]|uniref:hypothetical protein n=1 Tax=Anabaena sp. FACHB-1237 TaxID=2692769 RepID=UPI001681547F|nr:hypothetical protein [Anabaena sp. FACHB-1237]MBD2137599.1 hypothetical protein [Anabaena sp. FACHB-1237]
MPFDYLLLSGCLLPDQTSHREDGVEVRLTRDGGETVLFFHTDDQSNPNCQLRQLLGLDQQGQQMCDLIVFYAKDSTRIICFVELKGNKIAVAKEQVKNTYIHFNHKLKESGLSKEFISKCYIMSDGSVPQEYDKYKKELKSIFGEGNYDISRNSDLGAFLRGVKFQPKGKRKKGK